MDSNQKERGWLLPQRQKAKIDSGFYIVATPIGNLGDMSLRALDTLSAVDVILCEDTRVTKKLLSYYGISKPLTAFHDHTSPAQVSKILKKLQDVHAAALVSDAGMPLISDPGYELVRLLQEAGIKVTSLPGANAPLSALQLSGLPSDAFSFIGFLPVKSGTRKSVLQKWKDVQGTLIAFETAPRLLKALKDILEVLGDREIAVVREITKLFEESRRGSVSELMEYYEEHGLPKGEIVLVIGAGAAQELGEEELCALLEKVLVSMGTKEAASYVAGITGVSRKVLYELALGLLKRE